MKLLLTLLALILSFPGHSQNLSSASLGDDTSVSCVANWKLSDTKVYSIIHERKSISPTGQAPPFRFAYEAWISVLDSNEKNYTIKWVFHLPEEMSIFRPKLADSLPVYNGMKMIFRTTGTGAFVELLNWEEVRDTYTRELQLSRPKKIDSAASAAIKSAEEMFNSKEKVESAMIQEIQLFHVPYGNKFTTRQISENTKISSPFGGDPFPATQTYKVTELRSKVDSFTLAINMRMDKANAKSMIDGLIKQMNIKDDQEMQTAREKYSSFDLQDSSQYTFIKSTGWIRRLSYNRTVNIAGTTQSDIYTITLKE